MASRLPAPLAGTPAQAGPNGAVSIAGVGLGAAAVVGPGALVADVPLLLEHAARAKAAIRAAVTPREVLAVRGDGMTVPLL